MTELINETKILNYLHDILKAPLVGVQDDHSIVVKSWKESQIQIFSPILDLLQKHKEVKLGESMSEKAIQFIDERDDLQQQNKDLVEALKNIEKLDPNIDSKEGFNEWGEADCFDKAQIIAKAILEKYL